MILLYQTLHNLSIFKIISKELSDLTQVTDLLNNSLFCEQFGNLYYPAGLSG
ncbi:MAG: hypothetical protein LBS41_04545 [Streptococcaceae bacterium]|nr:hypothetical protein [Streptococcaceae bacterium]